jgi:cell division protein FtsB
MRRAVWALLAVVGIAALLFLFVLPGRTWLAQGHAMSAAEHRQAVLSAENAALSKEISALQQPSYIEQLARSELGLVMPGEKAYAVLPAASTSTTTAP